MEITQKFTGRKGEVVAAWITERSDLSYVTVKVEGEEEEWQLDEIQGAMDAYLEYGLDCMEHVA